MESLTARLRRFKIKIREKQSGVFLQSVQEMMEDAQLPVQQVGRGRVDKDVLSILGIDGRRLLCPFKSPRKKDLRPRQMLRDALASAFVNSDKQV